MYKIIINADDFGINHIVTGEIMRLIEKNYISSTTIMANGLCLDKVKDFAVDHPDISFGVHFCLSEHSSITKSSVLNKYGLTDKNGNFIHKAIFKIKKIDSTLKLAIKEELIAQYRIIKELGIEVSHADSHHHVHTIPTLTSVFDDVFEQCSISKIRLNHEFTTFRQKVHFFKMYKKWRQNMYYKKKYLTTDNFYSYSSFCSIVKRIKDNNQTIELMCHPGHDGKLYRTEIEILSNKLLNNLINFELISYNDLQ